MTIKGVILKTERCFRGCGEDICLEAYLNPEYALNICNALMGFAAPYIQYRNAMNEAVQKSEICQTPCVS